jgi:Trehalose utilisation
MSYSVTDEWYSYQGQPRTQPGLRILSTLNEATYNPSAKMGDHPISWYRAPLDSSRYYYTGAGHDWTFFRDTYWLRRQAYNGVVWAAGYTAPVNLSLRRAAASDAASISNISGSAPTVAVDREGPHTVVLTRLDGRIAARAAGTGRQAHTFANLESGAVYAVIVQMPQERTRKLINIP